jgi:hypothetical protein
MRELSLIFRKLDRGVPLHGKDPLTGENEVFLDPSRPKNFLDFDDIKFFLRTMNPHLSIFGTPKPLMREMI